MVSKCGCYLYPALETCKTPQWRWIVEDKYLFNANLNAFCVKSGERNAGSRLSKWSAH